MRPEVQKAVAELTKQFEPAAVHATEDGSGGAHVVIDGVDLGSRYAPQLAWIGGHIPAQYPYADIYPVFIASEVRRVDGVAFQPPVTVASFSGKSAWQVSRRSPTAIQDCQTASSKFLKIIHFLKTLP